MVTDGHLKAQAPSSVLGEHAEGVKFIGNTGRQPLVSAVGTRGRFVRNAVESGVAKPNHAASCSCPIAGAAVVVAGAGKAPRVASHVASA